VGGEPAAADSSYKVRLLATGDSERLRRRLRKATGKKVDLLLQQALQALLADLQLQQAPAASSPSSGASAGATVRGNIDFFP
jgi:hypothetical protein